MSKFFNTITFTLRERILCAQYDDEVWAYCRQALNGELSATDSDLSKAETILAKHLDVDAAQALFA